MNQPNMNDSKIGVMWGTLVALIVGFAFAWTAAPETTWLHGVILGLILIDLVALGVHYREKFKTRTALFGLTSIVSILLVFAIVGVLNFLAYRNPVTKDLTRNKVNSLADQTVKVVQNLKEDVEATFFSQIPAQDKYETLLENYRKLSPKFKLEIIDPNQSIVKAKEAGLRKPESLYLKFRDRSELLDIVDEERLTNALIKITQDKEKILCWLKGHGERDMGSSEPDGYSAAKSALEKQAFKVKEVNLPVEGKLPEDCGAIAIVGSTKAFVPGEVKLLKDYLAAGGRMYVAFDLTLDTEPAQELITVLDDWYIKPKRAVILDAASRLFQSDPTVPVVQEFSRTHAVTRDALIQAYFPFTRPIELKPNPPADLKIDWLAKTMPTSWAESNFEALKSKKSLSPKRSDLGAQIVAAAAEGKLKDSKAEKKTRIVVVGTSLLVPNSFARAAGNMDFFLNSVSWLLENENLISIRKVGDDKVELSQSYANVIFVATFLIVPFLITVAGIVIWVRRRRL